MEQSTLRKNKVCLTDYDYQKDIENRIILSRFSKTDLQVLEEILYSSLTFSIKKIVQTLDLPEKQVRSSIEKIAKTGLCSVDKENVQVDKELRKYFESQIVKFEKDFIPDLDFLQSMLKKVPIHVLPLWYSIPRTTDNIFDSLIEKYFLTPQTFQRYLLEINLGNPLLNEIVKEVFESSDLQVPSETIIKKYSLTKEQFEEHLLFLEFNFLCCLAYDSTEEGWREVVTPFREWKEYLQFLRQSQPKSLAKSAKLVRKRPADFSFIIDMSAVLKQALASPIPLKNLSSLAKGLDGWKQDDQQGNSYIERIIAKMRLVKLADSAGGKLYPLEGAQDFLSMPLENRALFLYRHPMNRILSFSPPASIAIDRAIRETERAISKVLHSGWIYFEDFIKGALIPLSEETVVKLKKQGRCWKYALPQYSTEEQELIKAILFEWFFEAGLIAVGVQDNKDCFSATSFGQTLFAK